VVALATIYVVQRRPAGAGEELRCAEHVRRRPEQHATLYGSLWTNDVNLQVGGSAIVDYGTQTLALANQVSGGEAMPAPLRVTLLADCAQIPAGTANGCP
jgi:hypothetical protein